MYTVILQDRVWRVRARSIQHLTQALSALRIRFLGVWEDENDA